MLFMFLLCTLVQQHTTVFFKFDISHFTASWLLLCFYTSSWWRFVLLFLRV